MEANAKFLSVGKPGKIGDQFPTCAGDEPVPPTFENVFNMVFATSCATCHLPGGTWAALDLSTPEASYAALLGADGNGAAQTCPTNPSPMVTPADAASSYLMAKLEKDGVRCGTIMPPTGLPEDQIDLVRQWINAGAPGPGANSSEMPEGDAGI